jgi:phosphoglycolate phosphatase-like HAD superfamily hydrolase
MTVLRAIISDFDGVILESNDLKTRAFEAVFAGFPEHADAMLAYHHAHVSDSRFAKFRHFVTACLGKPASDPLVEQLGAAFSAAMLRQMDGCPLVPGARQFLDRAHAALPVFLASVTPQDELDLILQRRGLAGYFTGVYGCPPWSKVAAVTEVVNALGGPEGVLFIGDSAGDQRAALETGVEFLARDSGLPFDAPLPRAFPDLVQLGEAIADRLPRSEKGPA